MKTTGYRIATANTAPGLALEVTKLLREGWELHGAPFVYNGIVAQALTHPDLEQE